MHSGWFPGFATALIFLLVGMLIGFPPIPLALMVGYTSATGPAFSDMAYDLKSGYILVEAQAWIRSWRWREESSSTVRTSSPSW